MIAMVFALALILALVVGPLVWRLRADRRHARAEALLARVRSAVNRRRRRGPGERGAGRPAGARGRTGGPGARGVRTAARGPASSVPRKSLAPRRLRAESLAMPPPGPGAARAAEPRACAREGAV